MSHWLEDAITQGMTSLDVDEVLAAQVRHLSQEGEWRKGVISPSLVATSCPLQRVKIFLGQDPVPGQKPHMASKAGRPDPVSLVNMVRGFDGEGFILAAIRRFLPYWVLDSAPTFKVEWTDPITGYQYAGHPDVLAQGAFPEDQPSGEYSLVQIKCPSVFKMDRVEKRGDDDALATYLPQMATEMFIARQAGLNVVANHLVLFSWEGTPKNTRPRLKAITVDWEPSLATIPEQAAKEIHDNAQKALMFNQWPEAFAKTSWDVWPCGYCRYARLGDLEVPACDDHEKWRSDARRQRTDPDQHGLADIPLAGPAGAGSE